jgi:predicted DNA-binding transcriptional regulator YafY
MEVFNNQDISILYTNYKGETRVRQIKPVSLYFGSTEYHQDSQWLLDAFDYEKQDFRQFAMKDIKEWNPT